MALRSLLVFAAMLLFTRCGARRFLSKANAIDVLLAIMIGSIGSRAITGNSSFGPSIASIAVLIAVHWLFNYIAFHTSNAGIWIKGSALPLVKDGEFQESEMRRSKITRRDLDEATRSKGIATDASGVQHAWLERDGSISIVRKKASDANGQDE